MDKSTSKPLDAYVRISRVAGRAGESFISPDVQLERIQAFAKARGITLGAVFTDLDQSGGKMKRPQLEKALGRIEQGASGGVIVARLDRLARTLVGGLLTIEEIQKAEGVVLSADGDLDTTTPTGRMVVRMMLTIAEYELDRIRDSWEVAAERAIKRGVHFASTTPVGYVRGDNGLEVDLIAGPIITEVFKRRANGESWKALRDLLDERLPRSDGQPWRQSTVFGVIRRETYLGVAHYAGHRKENAHPALVDRATFEAAGRRKSLAPPRREEGRLLAGLLTCGSCGGRMSTASRGARGNWAYRCQGLGPHGKCSHRVRMSGPVIDAFVEELLLEALAVDTPIELVASEPHEGLEAAVAALELAEAEVVAFRDSGLVSELGIEGFRAGLRVRQDRVEEARSRVADLKAEGHPEDYAEVIATWRELAVQERRLILSEVIGRITILPAPPGRGTPVVKRAKIDFGDPFTLRARVAGAFESAMRVREPGRVWQRFERELQPQIGPLVESGRA
jgi:site-specific DNA recombinase